MSYPPRPPAGPPPGPPPGGGGPAGSPPAGRPAGPPSTWPPPPGDGPAAGPGDPPFSDPVDLRDRSAAGAFRVPFSIADAFVALVAYFVGQLVAGLLFGVGLAITGGDPENVALGFVGLGGQVLGLALAAGYLVARRRLTWRLLGPVRPGWLQVALGLGIGIVGTIGAYTINAILVTAVGTEEPVEQEILQEVLLGGRATILAVLVAVVMAPLVEEVLFRGLLFQSLRRRVGMWPAALLSTAVFAVVHVEIILSQPVALAGLFALGTFLAWAFHRTGSLVVPIVGHAVFNGISVLLAVLAERFVELL